MALLKMELWIIKEKFPEQSARIEELYSANEDFKSLCSDYISCKRAMQDYEHVFNELELELHNFIFNHEA